MDNKVHAVSELTKSRSNWQTVVRINRLWLLVRRRISVENANVEAISLDEKSKRNNKKRKGKRKNRGETWEESQLGDERTILQLCYKFWGTKSQTYPLEDGGKQKAPCPCKCGVQEGR